MSETHYYWFIPKHNTIVQSSQITHSNGLFESREAAVSYIEQTELDVSPEETFLIEAETERKEDAALHVGNDWNSSDTYQKRPETAESEDIERLLNDWNEYNTNSIINGFEKIAEENPSLLASYIPSLVKRYDQSDNIDQRNFRSVLEEISAGDPEQVNTHLPEVIELFESNPSSDIAQALATVLPDESPHVKPLVEKLISKLDSDETEFSDKLSTANTLSTLTEKHNITIELITSTVSEQEFIHTELLVAAGLGEESPWEVDTESLVQHLNSEDQMVRRSSVAVLETRFCENDKPSVSADTISDLQSALVADWTTNNIEVRDRSRRVLAETAELAPKTIEQITPELITDIKDTIEWVPDDPAYGVVELTEYGGKAATTLGQYCTASGSVPTELVKVLADPERIQRARFLTESICEHAQIVIDELAAYAAKHPDTQRVIYSHLGQIAGGNHSGSSRAWKNLIAHAYLQDEIDWRYWLGGVRQATMFGNYPFSDISKLLELIPSNYWHERKALNAIAHIVENDPDMIRELWDYVEQSSQDPRQHSDTDRFAARALGSVAAHSPECFDDIDRCLELIRSNPGNIQSYFIHVIESVWGEDVELLKEIYPELMDARGIGKFIDPAASESDTQTLLRIISTVAKSDPNQVETQNLHALFNHDSSKIRKQVYDILGYAGSPEEYQDLESQLEVEDDQETKQAINQACTKLEIRFPDCVR
jgi:hypothetical protein